VNECFRRGVLSIVFAALAMVSIGVAAEVERAPVDAPNDGALARAELLMSEMLVRVQRMRAAPDADQRRALWAELRSDLAGLDDIERGDRLCPLCPVLVDDLAAAQTRDAVPGGDRPTTDGGRDRDVFLAAFPQVPVAGCAHAQRRDIDPRCTAPVPATSPRVVF
jgi:hypothetical protein